MSQVFVADVVVLLGTVTLAFGVGASMSHDFVTVTVVVIEAPTFTASIRVAMGFICVAGGWHIMAAFVVV